MKLILKKVAILTIFIVYLFISSAITPVYVNMIIGGIIGYVLGRMD
nr:MAG TPA: Protein of unknown function (DUF1043) [Caudoviricetes sp.]